VNLMVTGPTALKSAIGKADCALLPTVYVMGPHLLIRLSLGLITSY